MEKNDHPRLPDAGQVGCNNVRVIVRGEEDLQGSATDL